MVRIIIKIMFNVFCCLSVLSILFKKNNEKKTIAANKQNTIGFLSISPINVFDMKLIDKLNKSVIINEMYLSKNKLAIRKIKTIDSIVNNIG